MSLAAKFRRRSPLEMDFNDRFNRCKKKVVLEKNLNLNKMLRKKAFVRSLGRSIIRQKKQQQQERNAYKNILHQIWK